MSLITFCSLSLMTCLFFEFDDVLFQLKPLVCYVRIREMMCPIKCTLLCDPMTDSILSSGIFLFVLPPSPPPPPPPPPLVELYYFLTFGTFLFVFSSTPTPPHPFFVFCRTFKFCQHQQELLYCWKTFASNGICNIYIEFESGWHWCWDQHACMKNHFYRKKKTKIKF